ncbi:pca operon transcription factor PcaQ [Rhizobium sp. CFBP 8762]|uniref:pca operon transcription factor PcaQ n=1 Tax=Rhizobium sp. CFBP 8762 TaxID=2775279 RepID=UPI00177BF4B5|nr:pca operon transcription factor PcaQ [Rhizobium sp. CFBP 8762]
MLHPAIRLRHLVTFVEVARTQSVGRAAVNLSVTQPAVSKTMRELEIILDVALFDRTKRGTALTQVGEIFLRHAEAGLEAFRRGVEELGAASSPGARPIRIGALPTVSARLLPAAVKGYMAHGLSASPRIVTGPNAYLMRELREGALDLVVGRMGQPAEMVDLAFEHLYSERIVLVGRTGHPLLQSASFDPQALRRVDMLLPPPGSVIRATVDRLFLSEGLPYPRAVVETVSLAFGRAYVRETDAVWIISEGVVLSDIADGTMKALPVDTSDTLGPVGITMTASAPVAATVDVFLREIRRAALPIRQKVLSANT